MSSVDHIHLRCCHGVQTSNPRLASVLRRFNPHVFELENGVQPIPPLRQQSVQASPRVFLGNFNREQEQRQLASALRQWLLEAEAPQLVTVGPTGLEGLLPPERLVSHPPLAYPAYRQLLASCQVALLPLQCGEPQACKTPIKWLEAAAESVAVVAGPELYGPWLEQGRYGLFASELSAMVPLARQLMEHPQQRMELVERAHARVHDFQLERLLPWRMSLYRHLNRLAQPLERALERRFPIRGNVHDGWKAQNVGIFYGDDVACRPLLRLRSRSGPNGGGTRMAVETLAQPVALMLLSSGSFSGSRRSWSMCRRGDVACVATPWRSQSLAGLDAQALEPSFLDLASPRRVNKALELWLGGGLGDQLECLAQLHDPV